MIISTISLLALTARVHSGKILASDCHIKTQSRSSSYVWSDFILKENIAYHLLKADVAFRDHIPVVCMSFLLSACLSFYLFVCPVCRAFSPSHFVSVYLFVSPVCSAFILIIIIIKALFNERTHLTMSIFREALKYNIHVFTRQIYLNLSTVKPVLSDHQTLCNAAEM